MDFPNIVSMAVERWGSDPTRTAYWHRQADGSYVAWSWADLAERVYRTAAGLANLGVRAGDRVVLLAENRSEWIVCDLTIQGLAAIHVPLHASLAPEQVALQITDSGATLAIVSTAAQAEKLNACSDQLPEMLKVVAIEPGTERIGTRSVTPLAELAGSSDVAAGEQLLQQAREQLASQSPATILYTSGTTGEPKGVVLTHGNLVSNAVATVQAFDIHSHHRRLSFLPLSHIFARTCDIYTWLAAGHELALAGSRETVLADIKTFQPTILNGVPYFYELVQRHVQQCGKADQAAALRETLGGRIEYLCSGGAALPDPLFDFYAERGLPILQGYGLTESSPVISLNRPTRNRRGTVGQAIEGIEVRIADDGEILTRGPHVMAGYWQNPDATAEVIRDGWLHTGDLGSLDQDGFLRITGRKKELIVTAGGKNVAPALLEGLLTQDPLIHQVMVVGDGRNFLTALIVPNPDALRQEILARRIPVFSPAQALAHPQVHQLYQERIDQRLATVSYYEQVRRFTLLDRAFSLDKGEVTPKMSLRRDVIAKNFAEQIERMYAG